MISKCSNSRWSRHWFIIGNKELLSDITCWCVFYSVHINQWGKINLFLGWISFLVGTSSIHSRTASKKQIYFLKWWSLLATSSSFNFTVGFPVMISVFMKHEKNPRTVKCAYYIVYELVASLNWQKT